MDCLVVLPSSPSGVPWGAGTGRTAALLAHRAGARRVISVETDPDLAAEARERLQSVRAGVELEVGGGAAGWPQSAPYDRVMATYAVEAVPWTWAEQTRPGGRIVTPVGPVGACGADGRHGLGFGQRLGPGVGPLHARTPRGCRAEISPRPSEGEVVVQ
ncbi:methyltransferase domain-containing protein [Streptomyces sp. NPDC051776]|uniref:protein-L-isoaspartate O-methyltransferase family protein n=1 Tax=Streptomyces sp. NPDC051776 TaxID=3155414 RepID=UPI0034257BA7